MELSIQSNGVDDCDFSRASLVQLHISLPLPRMRPRPVHGLLYMDLPLLILLPPSGLSDPSCAERSDENCIK